MTTEAKTKLKTALAAEGLTLTDWYEEVGSIMVRENRYYSGAVVVWWKETFPLMPLEADVHGLLNQLWYETIPQLIDNAI